MDRDGHLLEDLKGFQSPVQVLFFNEKWVQPLKRLERRRIVVWHGFGLEILDHILKVSGLPSLMVLQSRDVLRG